MTVDELLDALYKEIQPKTFKDFWMNLSKYLSTYPVLKDVSLFQAQSSFNRNRINY